jgi:hypothetical protein
MADMAATDMMIVSIPGIGALLMSSWQFLAKRNVDHLDKALEDLAKAIGELRAAVKNIGDDLGKQIVDLRLTDRDQAKDIGALQEGQRALERRIEGQASFYREQLGKLTKGRTK